ncbi:hypothetical protein F5Y18DRAFT_159795 [Xylariaceae sp. FL1019]|nr:hypothetical protein F5Y18DRAFT_159795 [Xylariaceae sp. FL1019]
MARFDSLPVEARLMIWRFAVPAVRPQRDPQVFRLTMDRVARAGDSQDIAPYHVLPVRGMKQQTARVRTMLSVHRESRAEALKYFPHVLTINDRTGAIIRFNRDVDLVLLEGLWYTSRRREPAAWEYDFLKKTSNYRIDDFNASIRHLGFGPGIGKFLHGYYDRDIWSVMMFLRTFTKLVAVYNCSYIDESTSNNLDWCTSDKANKWEVTKEPPLSILSWPDILRGMDQPAVNLFEIMIRLLLRESHKGRIPDPVLKSSHRKVC